MQKYKNEAGQVAVLYSPGFGSGWSTWAAVTDNACLFDPETVQWVLDGKDPLTQPNFVKKFKATKPEDQHITFYASAAYDLEVSGLILALSLGSLSMTAVNLLSI